jgi:hypothetical protein
VTGDPAEAALREITAAYERARYGGGPGDEREVERAGQNADLLVTSLLDIADDAGSRAAPEGE